MARNDEDARKAPLDQQADKDGVLPDGVRGTTRDIGHTVPSDEHAGYKDPAKPDTRKPS